MTVDANIQLSTTVAMTELFDGNDAPACASCRFWDQQEPTPGDEIVYGLCRRFPPDDHGWPGTTTEDWCGEFADRAPRV